MILSLRTFGDLYQDFRTHTALQHYSWLSLLQNHLIEAGSVLNQLVDVDFVIIAHPTCALAGGNIGEDQKGLICDLSVSR